MTKLGLSTCLFIVACSGSGELDERPLLARVGGVPVYADEFRRELRRIRLEGESGLPDATSEAAQKRALLEDVIERRLLLAEAEKQNVIVGSDEIEAAYQKSRSGWKDEDFNALLAEKDMTPAELKNELRDQLLIKRYFRDHVFSRVAVTDAEIAAYIDAHPEVRILPEQVRARHIVVKTEEEATRILGEIKAGTAFEDAAMKYSLSPDGKNGGDLGYFKRGVMPRIFDEVCFSLVPGTPKDTSEVVASDDGFHVFKVLERLPERARPFEDARAFVETTLRRQKEHEAQLAKVKELEKAAIIEVKEEQLARIH